MKILVLIELLCFSLNQYILYLQHIFTNNNHDINFQLYGQNLPNITENNIFDIILNSENNEENITFNCDLFGINSTNSSNIKCILKENFLYKDEETFYLSQKHLQKSFSVFHEKKYLNFTIEIIEDFYLGIINISPKEIKENSFEIKLNYKNLGYNNIPISMALDNNYIYPTIVAITTMLIHSNPRTIYHYYIMHSPDFSEENKEMLEDFEIKYNNCKIYLINMKNSYKDAKTDKHLSTPTYYRLSLSELLPNLDKIIWLDGDTITYADLKEMYDIDMINYLYKGLLDESPNCVDHITFNNDKCICAGVMLINLKDLRKENIVKKFSEFIRENNDKLTWHDQTTINALCYDKIDILPPKFGIYNYLNKSFLLYKNRLNRYKYKYKNEEYTEAFSNPKILHFVFKPWHFFWEFDKSESWMPENKNEWWHYVNVSGFYDKISKKYPRPVVDKPKKLNKKKIKKILKYVALFNLFLFI